MVKVSKTTDGRKLIYNRQFEFGKDNQILFPAAAYPQIKKVFDFIQEQDGYTVSLRQVSSAK